MTTRRVAALERIADALSRWSQWWTEDPRGRYHCEVCGAWNGSDPDAIEHHPRCAIGVLEEVMPTLGEFSPAVGGQTEEDHPDPLGLADQPGLLVDESGSPVDLGLPATASAWADEMRPEYDFSEATRGPVIVRQTLGSTGPASDAASELLGFLAGLSRYFPNGSQAEEIRLRGMEFVRNAADPLGLAAEILVLREALEGVLLTRSGYKYGDWDGEPWVECEWCSAAAGSSELIPHGDACPLRSTPSPAAQAVREVVARAGEMAEATRFLWPRTMSEDDHAVASIYGVGIAVDHLRTNFPTLAAGLETQDQLRSED